MISLQLKQIKDVNKIEKNKLYKVGHAQIIPFVEKQQMNDCDIVNVDFEIHENQYGIYATEFRNPLTQKGKSADILACVVDPDLKQILTLILDSKRNISAFSDDLTTEDTAIRALHEVQDFAKQIGAGILHKDSILLYYLDEQYCEHMQIGLATKNFEAHKFSELADYVDGLMSQEVDAQNLILMKVQRMLEPYAKATQIARKMAQQKLLIRDKEYHLNIYRLKQNSNMNYECNIVLQI